MKYSPSAISTGQRINGLMSVSAAAALIEAGAPLAIAGRAEALAGLPRGCWIGGTTPYLMTESGGCIIGADQLFVTDFSHLGTVRVNRYDQDNLQQITAEAPHNGFALTIIPFHSSCHKRFAQEAGSYPQAYLRPAIGWIAGFDLNDQGAQAQVFDGITGRSYTDRAVVLHIQLPEDFTPVINMINLFERDGGQTFHFDDVSFSPSHVVVDGVRLPFADYIRSRGMGHGRLPMVGGYAGAHTNVSLRSVHGNNVELYAPVFPDVEYGFARPVSDYAAEFRKRFESGPRESVAWSCNCILNFLYGELEGKALGSCAGPVTFGEIAHGLLNQTLVEVQVI